MTQRIALFAVLAGLWIGMFYVYHVIANAVGVGW